jgi:hypothetical protein
MLSREPAQVTAGGGGSRSRVLVQGFTAQDVASLAVSAPGGRVDASLSERWTPPDWPGGPLRVFYAAVPWDDQARVGSFLSVKLEATLADGQRVDIGR